MNTSKNPVIDKNNPFDEPPKRTKKDANLKYNPTLYFLVGLVITLLSSYSLLEMNFKVKNPDLTTYNLPLEDSFTYNHVSYVVEKEKPVVQKQPKKTFQNLIISDAPVVIETPAFIDEPVATEAPSESFISIIEPPENLEVPIVVVEHVPEYPGCEKGSNAAKRKCMSKKIAKFVQRKFNTDLAEELGLTGHQRISVVFKIDTKGNVIGVRSRAPHPRLEQEAARVINLLPQMKPGRQRGNAVVVPYSLPINFKVQD